MLRQRIIGHFARLCAPRAHKRVFLRAMSGRREEEPQQQILRVIGFSQEREPRRCFPTSDSPHQPNCAAPTLQVAGEGWDRDGVRLRSPSLIPSFAARGAPLGSDPMRIGVVCPEDDTLAIFDYLSPQRAVVLEASRCHAIPQRLCSRRILWSRENWLDR